MRKLCSGFRIALDRRRIIFVFFLGVTLLTSTFAAGQSGRKIPKKSESEGVQKPTQTEPEIKPETKKAEEVKIPVMLAKSNSHFGTSYAGDYVLGACAARLKESAALQIEKSPGDLGRKQASEAAKASANKYVVLLELSADTMRTSRDRLGREYNQDIVIDYTVFAPGTGKAKTSGRVYQNRTRGAVGLPVPGGPAAADYTLKQAGREVADRVIDSLMAEPSPPPGK